MKSVVAVFLGGACGTLFRFLCGAPFTSSDLLAPWVINVVGGFILGLLVGWLWMLPGTSSWLKAGLGTGLLGGFTTFSAIALELGQSFFVDWTIAFHTAGIFVGELVLGLLAAWGGLVLGRLLSTHGTRPSQPAGQHHRDGASVHPVSDDGVDL